MAQMSGSETQNTTTSYLCHVCLGIIRTLNPKPHCFPVVGMVIKIIVGVYIPIIRIPVISCGMSEHPQYKKLIDPKREYMIDIRTYMM